MNCILGIAENESFDEDHAQKVIVRKLCEEEYQKYKNILGGKSSLQLIAFWVLAWMKISHNIVA